MHALLNLTACRSCARLSQGLVDAVGVSNYGPKQLQKISK